MILNFEFNKNFGNANNISSKFRYMVALQKRTKIVTRLSNLNNPPLRSSPGKEVTLTPNPDGGKGLGYERDLSSLLGTWNAEAYSFSKEHIGVLSPKVEKDQTGKLSIPTLGGLQHEEYLLETFKRSNQDTCLTHKPNVTEGSWVQSGDLLTDCASSVGGDLSLGQNLLIAYMPWEGYNFEDAILISERLVIDDLYTSIHIERYELEIQKTKLGAEEITRNIPDVSEQEIAHLDSFGVVKLGSWIEEGDILIGKITPINKKKISPYQKLLYSILEKQVRPIKDSSLRAPKGIKAKVIDIKYFFKPVTKTKSSTFAFAKAKAPSTTLSKERQLKAEGKDKQQKQKKQSKKERITTTAQPLPFFEGVQRREKGGWLTTSKSLFWRNRNKTKVKKSFLKKINLLFSKINYSSFNLRFILFCSRFWSLDGLSPKGNDRPSRSSKTLSLLRRGKAIEGHSLRTGYRGPLLAKKPAQAQESFSKLAFSMKTFANSNNLGNVKTGKVGSVKTASIKNKNIETIHIYLAEKRKIQVGDKMAGRHGNKGIVSQILPIQDMPFLPDGTPIDMVLNPLGVPSRMNVGQIYECLLGFAGKFLGENYKISSFDEIYGPEASRTFVFNKLYEASTKTGFKWLFDPNSPGKTRLFDGRNGELFDQKVTVGLAYMLRLVHMVDDKIHCLTPDHDVLTTNGWIPINKITIKHKVATLERSTGKLVYQNPINVFNYPQYSGALYHVKNTNIDLLVTLNHRMLVKYGKNNGSSFADYSLIEAKDIVGKHYKYLKNANWKQENYQFSLPAIVSNSISIPERKVNMDAWLTFFGLWIAKGWTSMAGPRWPVVPLLPPKGDGKAIEVHQGAINNNNEIKEKYQNTPNNSNDFDGLSNTVTNFKKKTSILTLSKPKHRAVYQVQVCQRKQRVVNIIKKAVESLGYAYRIIDDKITIHDKQLCTYLRSLSIGAQNKYLPSWVWELSQSQSQKLLEGLCLGDDTWLNTSVSYNTTSVKLADDVMRLALHAGWSGNKYLHIPKGAESMINGRKILAQYDVWRVSIIKGKNNPAVNHGHNGNHEEQNSQIEEILPSYQGSVHCLSVPNEIFYVRRNGFPVWTGNSRSTGPYSLVTQQPLRGRSKQGGQRLGEMEVWAIEGYGAAFTLLEMLTIKSDDMTGRMTLWSNLILNKEISIGTPESFKVLICELQALCLDIGLYRSESRYTETYNKKGNIKLREIQNLMNLP